MSDAPTSPSSPSPAQAAPPTISIFNIALVVVPALLIAGGVWWYTQKQSQVEPQQIDVLFLSAKNLVTPDKLVYPNENDPAANDKDGDLLADDAPADQQLKIESELVLTTLDDAEKETWEAFAKYLSGRLKEKLQKDIPVKVERRAFLFQEDQEDFRKGKVHIAQLSTGTVTRMVNTAGFIPLVMMADDEGKAGYQMEILVPASSDIQNLDQLRGRTLVLAAFSSHSACKFPILKLHQEKKWLPEKDYTVIYSGSQRRSIKDVVEGQAPAVAVANDLVKRMAERDKLDLTKVRSIYKSETLPPAVWGVSHAMPKPIREAILQAFLDYSFPPEMKKAYATANQTKFVKIDYKNDPLWKFVRDCDQALNALCQKK